MTRWEDWESAAERPSTPPPRTIGDLVAQLAQTKRWDRRLHGARIHQVWDEVAGPALAQHVHPVRLAGGVLVVRADSPTWATQVQYLSAELAARANAVLGDGEVKQVRVQGGAGSMPKNRR